AEHKESALVVKSRALSRGSEVAIFAPASPADESRVRQGLAELRSLGFVPRDSFAREAQGYFSATADSRFHHFSALLSDANVAALFALRGGYGSNYLLERLWMNPPSDAKCLIGYSDVTSLQVLLWQKLGWVSFYGPMAAAGLDAGVNA